MVGTLIVLGIIMDLLAAFDVALGTNVWHVLCVLSLVGATIQYGREQKQLMRIIAANTQLARDMKRDLDRIRETSESIRAAQEYQEPPSWDS